MGDHLPKLGGPIARMVLVAVAMARGRMVTDDELIDGIWGEFPPDSVVAALRVHVSSLRGALAPASMQVVRSSNGYVLDGPHAMDTDELDSTEQMQASAAEIVRATARTLDLWRGSSLADVRRLPLGTRLGAALDRRRELLVDRHAEVLVEHGRASDAIAVVEPGLMRDPFNEKRWALLSLALAQAGWSAEALRALERGRHQLVDIGLVPGPAMRDAERRVLAGDLPRTTADRARPDLPFDLVALADTRMFGRADLLSSTSAELRRHLETGRSAVMEIVGESGAGKSLFAAHLAAALAESGVRTFYAASDEGGGRPLDPLVRIIGIVASAGIEPRGPQVGDDPADLVASRATLLERTRRQLATLARDGPALIVLDDVQWADELTTAVLRRIAKQPIPVPVVFVVMERASASRAGMRGATPVELERLSADAIAEWLDCAPDDPDTVAVVSLTDGLGWLVAETMAQLRRGRDIGGIASALAPRLLDDRLRAAEVHTPRLLEWASELGLSFDVDALVAVTGAADLDLLEDVDRLVDARVLSYVPDDPSRIRFDHALLRDAVGGRIGVRRRSRMHALILDRLSSSMTDLERLRHADHAVADLDPARYAGIALTAARSLVEQLSFGEAKRVASGALSALTTRSRGERSELDTSLVGLHVVLARAMAALGDAAAAREELTHAQRLATASGDDRAVAEVIAARPSLLGQRFVTDPETTRLIESLLERLGDDSDPIAFALIRQLAFLELNNSDLASARAAIDRARAVAPLLGPRAVASTLLLEHWLASTAGDDEARRRTSAHLTALADGSTDHSLRGRALSLAVTESIHAGDTSATRAIADELEQAGDVAGEPHTVWVARCGRFTSLFTEGDIAAAAAAADSAASFGFDHSIVETRGVYATHLYGLDWVRGGLAPWVERLQQLDAPQTNVVWRAALALALASAGSVEDARKQLDSIVGVIPDNAGHWLGLVGVAMAVEAAWVVGHRETHIAARPHLESRRDQHIVIGNGAMEYGPASRYAALATAGCGDPAASEHLLRTIYSAPGTGELWRRRALVDLRKVMRWRSGESMPSGTTAPWNEEGRA